jgi:2-phosphosulfolactate phosphatase
MRHFWLVACPGEIWVKRGICSGKKSLIDLNTDGEMQIQRATLDSCAYAEGTVVVIDVLRAFTTAAFAFAAGAQEIFLVRTIEEALALRDRVPDSQIMGEFKGLPVPGFDYSNSPADIAGKNLNGRRLIQRTSSGTQGVVLSERADIILPASFVCASATARYLNALDSQQVTLVNSGYRPPGGQEGWPAGLGTEDEACADYIEALLRAETPDEQPYIRRVRESYSGSIFADPRQPEHPAIDLDYCTQVDRFAFAMRVYRQDGLLVMRAEDSAV